MDHNQEQINLYVALGKIQAAQELILDGLKTHFEDDKKNFQAIADRISRIETKINYAAGIAVAVVSVFSFFWTYLINRIS